MTNILTQLQQHMKYFFLVIKIRCTGNSMPYRLDWADKVFLHHARLVRTVCISPELQAIDAEHIFQRARLCCSQITDRLDTVAGQLLRCGAAYIEQL